MNSANDCARITDGRLIEVGSGSACVCEAACVVERGHAASPKPHAGPLSTTATAPSSDPMRRHTRSMIFSPNNPCGRNSRNTNATTYANQFSIAPPTSGPQ